MSEQKYRSLPFGCTLGEYSIEQALGMLNFARPTLHHGKGSDWHARQMADNCRINCVCDPTLSPYEWYVTYNDDSVGSKGE